MMCRSDMKEYSDFLQEITKLKDNYDIDDKKMIKIMKVCTIPLAQLKEDSTCDVIPVDNKWIVKGKNSKYKTFDNELMAYRIAKLNIMID